MNIEAALVLAQQETAIFPENYEECLKSLEEYECWDHWFRLVDHHARKTPTEFGRDQIRLAQVYLKYFDDVDAASMCCVALVESSGLAFAEFKTEVLAKTIEQNDYAVEGLILQRVWEKFQSLDDRVSVVERLCYIYEKKIHNELLLNQFYERLRKLQPTNTKALRFFRTLNTQLQDWASVVEILRKLLAGARHPQEGFRYAQEMAAVYLYHMDDPEMAISIIEEHCSNSTLDTSTIHYEAYYRIGKIDGCLRVLRSCLLSIEDFHTRAVVHFRLASLYEQMNQLDLSLENYRKTIELYPQFVEAIEGIVSIGLRKGDWQLVKESLKKLGESLNSPSLVSQVQAGIARLEEGTKVHANA
jgi:tetratricopeptide (TPR) repeat protein